jgi:hypothetical protein
MIQALNGACVPGARLIGYALMSFAVVNHLAGSVHGFYVRHDFAHGLIPPASKFPRR